jgi:NAD(P)-dependent dehydrogenase (short-subunit alcohol dehydrogenase family)
MNIDLSGKNVLVTGGSRGIGRAISLALGESGARVAVHYRARKEEAEHVANEAGNESRAFDADLSNVMACESLFSRVLDVFGSLDVLINNAGVAIESPIDSANNQWVPIWDATLDVNLRATALLSKLAIAHFLKKKPEGGRLIHIASRAAFRGDTPEYLAYAASKGGMVAFSRSIARGFGKHGICSFILAPGFVRTEMAQDFIDQYGEDHVADDLALSRLTEPEDLAPMVVLLASGLADHATGTSIDFNAGSYVR